MTEEAIRFRAEKKFAHLHDPRRNFELAQVESEIRFDPLTGSTGRICHFSLANLSVPDLSGIVAESRAMCPFCPGKVESITPRFPEEVVPGGRMRRGEAVLFPNLFPYDDASTFIRWMRSPSSWCATGWAWHAISSCTRETASRMAAASGSQPGTTCRRRAARRCIRTCRSC